MSEEKKQNDAPEVSDEQLKDIAAGGTYEMKWDNVKNVKATDFAIEELQIANERIEVDED